MSDPQYLEIDEAEGTPDYLLLSRIDLKLKALYPFWRWQVNVDDRHHVGMLTIALADVNVELNSNFMYGYKLKLTRVYADPNLDCVMRAAGEILERAGLTRGKRRPSDQVTHVDGVADKHQPLLGKVN